MSTATVAPRAGRHEAAPAGSPWTGVGSLIRLAIRRDRLRLSVWIAILTLMMVYAPNAIKLAYPEEAQRLARVNLLKTPAGMMLGGPMFGGNETDLGAMMANELMLTLIVATSILSILGRGRSITGKHGSFSPYLRSRRLASRSIYCLRILLSFSGVCMPAQRRKPDRCKRLLRPAYSCHLRQ